MTEFKVGDKVSHRTFGAGVIRFGPYKASALNDAYLLEGADGRHRMVEASAMTLETGETDQVEALAKAIAESDGEPWDSSYVDQDTYRKNARAALAVLKERGELETGETDRPLQAGDTVRVLVDDPGYHSGELVGKVGTLESFSLSARLPYRVRFDFMVPSGGRHWHCESVERVDAEPERVRDKDGDYHRRGTDGRYRVEPVYPDSLPRTYAALETRWGPLTPA